MDDVKRVPSSEFRVTYVRATEPIAVTVLGRVIGYWIPGAQLANLLIGEGPNQELVTVLRRTPTPRPGQEPEAARIPAPGDTPDRAEAPDSKTPPPHQSPPGALEAPQAGTTDASGNPRSAGTSVAGMSQAERDAVLRRVASPGAKQRKGG